MAWKERHGRNGMEGTAWKELEDMDGMDRIRCKDTTFL